MYEACVLNLLQQVGWSPHLLESRLRPEVRTFWYSKDPLPSLPLPQSNLLSFGSPRWSPKLFLQIQVPYAQTWGPSGSVCSAAGASVITVFSWSHFQYLYHQRAPAVAYHQHGPCSQNQSVWLALYHFDGSFSSLPWDTQIYFLGQIRKFISVFLSFYAHQESESWTWIMWDLSEIKIEVSIYWMLTMYQDLSFHHHFLVLCLTKPICRV